MRKSARITELTVVACAVVMTAFVARREFASSHTTTQPTLTFARPDSLYHSVRRIGRADAPLKLVMWTDYQCPACDLAEESLRALRLSLGDSLVLFVHPIAVAGGRPLSMPAAVLAECAGRSGRFAESHDALFGSRLPTRSRFPRDSLVEALGFLQNTAFEACMNDRRVEGEIETATKAALTVGIRATPSFLIADSVITGAAPGEVLLKALRGRTSSR